MQAWPPRCCFGSFIEVIDMQHEQNWVLLSQILGPRSPLFRPLIEAFGSPEAIFAAKEEQIRVVLPDIGAGTLGALRSQKGAQAAQKICLYCHRNGVRILPFDSAEYPALLRELDEPPVLLYVQGRLPDFGKHASVGIVGPRRADAYGERVAYKLSFELAAAGAVVVSGMAQGIDGIATAAAIAAGGSAIAVLGCGIDIVYPKHHGKLMAECREHGAVITEYAPGTPPNGYNFPVRNRLISALSRSVLVVQAGEHSGALITARYAIMQGRPLYAVPGDITEPRSQGSNRLLQAGAHPALSAGDVLFPLLPRYHATLNEQSMREAEQYSMLDERGARRFGLRLSSVQRMEKQDKKEKKKIAKGPSQEKELAREEALAPDLSALTPRQRELYACLPHEPFSVDALAGQGVPVAEAISTLTILEIYGLLVTRPGGMYQIANPKE